MVLKLQMWREQQMKICNKKAVELTPEQEEEIRIQSYFDRITPSVLRFYPDYYICGNNYCSVWAIREYAPKTQEPSDRAR